MAVWYAQNSSPANIDAVSSGTTSSVWNAAMDGSGAWMDISVLTAGGTDTVLSANGNSGIAINVDLDIGTGRLSTVAESGGAAGGGFTVAGSTALAVTGTAQAGTSACITCNHTGTGANAFTITSVVGGTGENRNGLVNKSTGTVNVTNVTGGSAGEYAYGLRNVSTGTINATNVVGGSGGSVPYGIHNASTGAINVVNVRGGTGGSRSAGIYNQMTGAVTITGNIINTAYGTALVGGSIIYNPGAGNYIQHPTSDGHTNHYFGLTIPASKVLDGEVGDGVDLPAEGTAVVPDADEVLDGVAVGSETGTVLLPNQNHVWTGAPAYGASGALQGNMAVPSVTDVRTGVHVGNGSENVLGTCAVPLTSVVLTPYACDDATGVLVIPAESNVLAGVTYGAYRNESVGNYATVGVEDVADGVTFGPGGSLEGTLAGSGGVIVIDD